MYVPRELNATGIDAPALAQYLAEELQEIARQIQNIDFVIFQILHREPSKRVAGLVVYADGTDWNPGSGAGLYRWNGAAWIFVG